MNFKDYADLIRAHKTMDLKKLSYHLDAEEMEELVHILTDLFMQRLSLVDRSSIPLTVMPALVRVPYTRLRSLLMPQAQPFEMDAMTDEIRSTLAIENIPTTRESVRRIMGGQAPEDASEIAIYQMKQSIDYISDPAHEITVENILGLYQIVFRNQLPEDHKTSATTGFRDDAVYVRSSCLDSLPVHTGIPYEHLPERMQEMVDFAQNPANLDDLTAAAVLHFYLAYLHPWFDGNGRMARLLHLWYLVQKGYPSILYVTPFIAYFAAEVYDKIALA